MSKKVLFFDSGIGGLTTLATTLKLCPTLSYIFVADTKHAPYGKLTNKQVIKYTKNCIKPFISSGEVGAIVLACNTATNCAVEALRQEFSIPIIGIEPAILPAIKSTATGKILVLATPTTVMQPKFEALTKPHLDKLLICPMPTLATQIEELMETNDKLCDQQLNKMLINLSNTHQNIGAVVLGCTHYSIIKDKIQSVFQVPCFDGNLGVANQLLRTLGHDKNFFKSAKSYPMIITTSTTKTNYTKILADLLNN